MTDTAAARANLVADLIARGHLADPALRAAVAAVPREAFLGERVFRLVPDSSPALWTPVYATDPDWAAVAYTDESLVTQLDHGSTDTSGAGLVGGVPTSSSTLPSLVVGMIDDLDLRPGMRVLEIGTGTGYSTALLCERLGDACVTSIEVDPDVAERAAKALNAAGYRPRLVVGDGLEGYAEAGPYDRIIATCAVRHIPWPWLEQAAPGAIILATLFGWQQAYFLAWLEATSPGEVRGRYAGHYAGFMPARPHAAPPLGTVTRPAGPSRPTDLDPMLLHGADSPTRLVAQLAVPDARVMAGVNGNCPTTIVWDSVSGSGAWVESSGDGGWLVQQGGPVALWDQIESAVLAWRQAGSPGYDQFGVAITGGRQYVWAADPRGGGVRWALKTP